MSHYREILSALHKLKSGAGKLTTEQYVDVLDAIEQATQALYSAPRGGDAAAMGLWWNHERNPALARLADALSAHDPVEPITATNQNGAVTQPANGASGVAAPAAAHGHETAEAVSADGDSAQAPARRSSKLRAAKDGDGPSDAEVARALYNALLDSAER